MKNKAILLKLLRIKKPLHDRFDFTVFNEMINGATTKNKIHNCGTAGCLLGNIPKFDSDIVFGIKGLLWHLKEKDCIFDESDYFNLPHRLCRVLFYPLSQEKIDNHIINSVGCKATLEEVQDNIKKIMELVPKYFIEE